MKKISIWNYSISFWKRDILFSLFAGIFSMGIFFFLIHSIRLQYALSGGITISSIDGLKNSPDLLFYLSIFSLSFLVLGTVFPRMSDLGVMMAVGGNAWICVYIQILLIFIQTMPAYVLANVLNFVLVPDPGSTRFLMDFIMIQLQALLIYFSIVIVIGVPFVYLATLKDPYASIRRLK
jgi:hypothetical protein